MDHLADGAKMLAERFLGGVVWNVPDEHLPTLVGRCHLCLFTEVRELGYRTEGYPQLSHFSKKTFASFRTSKLESRILEF